MKFVKLSIISAYLFLAACNSGTGTGSNADSLSSATLPPPATPQPAPVATAADTTMPKPIMKDTVILPAKDTSRAKK